MSDSKFPDYKSLEDAYRSCVKGDGHPHAFASCGKVILRFSPELADSIDPNEWYLVVNGKITKVEDP